MNPLKITAPLSNQNGLTTATAVMLLTALALTGSLALSYTMRDRAHAGRYQNAAQLRYIAEAGINAGLAELRKGTVETVNGQEVTVLSPTSFNNGNYEVRCETSGDGTMGWLRSTGTLGTRSLQMEATLAIAPCAAGDDRVDFDIDDGTVIPAENYQATATVLGAAFQFSWGWSYYNAPITIQISVGTQTADPWGDFLSWQNGNINDGNNPRSYLFPQTFSAHDPITVTAKAFSRCGYSCYSHYRTVASSPATDYVKVLRNGDTPPSLDGYLDQSDVVDFMQEYIVGGLVALDENQAIYLFEMYTALSGSTADFQDVVVLVTLTPEGEEVVEEAPAEEEEEEVCTGPTYRVTACREIS